MIQRWLITIVTMLSGLLILTNLSADECPWVLWIEAPVGSDQWSIASVPESRFALRQDCQRWADELNPEGALVPDTIDPRGPKGK